MSMTDEDRSEISALEDAVDALRAQLAVVEVLENEAAGLRQQIAAALAKRDALRDRLAVVERQRDDHRDAWARVAKNFAEDTRRQRAERDAALARVKALEAALDISDGAVMHSRWCLQCAEGDPCADIADAVAQVSARASARAGLTKEGE